MGIIVLTSSVVGHQISGASCLAIKAIYFLKILEMVDWYIPNLYARSFSSRFNLSFIETKNSSWKVDKAPLATVIPQKQQTSVQGEVLHNLVALCRIKLFHHYYGCMDLKTKVTQLLCQFVHCSWCWWIEQHIVWVVVGCFHLAYINCFDSLGTKVVSLSVGIYHNFSCKKISLHDTFRYMIW